MVYAFPIVFRFYVHYHNFAKFLICCIFLQILARFRKLRTFPYFPLISFPLRKCCSSQCFIDGFVKWVRMWNDGSHVKVEFCPRKYFASSNTISYENHEFHKKVGFLQSGLKTSILYKEWLGFSQSGGLWHFRLGFFTPTHDPRSFHRNFANFQVRVPFYVISMLFSERTAGRRKRLGRNPGKTYGVRNFCVGKLVMVRGFSF